MDILELLRKKRELKGKINDLRAEVRELKHLISDFNACKKDIDEAMSNWISARTGYQNILLEPVKVTQYFEGDAAERVKSRLLPTIAAINSANVTMVSIKSGIPHQIELIEEKIEELEEQIVALEAELAALG